MGYLLFLFKCVGVLEGVMGNGFYSLFLECIFLYFGFFKTECLFYTNVFLFCPTNFFLFFYFSVASI